MSWVVRHLVCIIGLVLAQPTVIDKRERWERLEERGFRFVARDGRAMCVDKVKLRDLTCK